MSQTMQGVQLRCIRCGAHCTHVSIPRGLRAVALIQVSRSEQDGFTYARCTDRHCHAWTRYELVVQVMPAKKMLDDLAA